MSEFVVSLPVPRFLVRQPIGSEHDVDVVPGLRHDAVQSFDLMVSHSTTTELFTVVVGTRPVLSDHDRSVIAQALAATRRPVIVFLVSSDPQGWQAECSATAESAAAAAAVGVVGKAVGRQDDSLDIAVGGRRHVVTAARDGQKWRCWVE